MSATLKQKMIDDFINYLSQKASLTTITLKSGNKIYRLDKYWHYDESVSAEHMDELLDEMVETDSTFSDLVVDFADKHEALDELDVLRHWDNFVQDYPQYDDDFNQFDAHMWCIANVHSDPDINQWISNSRPTDLVLYFGQNWDDDYTVIQEWSQLILSIEESPTVLTEEQQDLLTKSTLGWLIQSQGYQPLDVLDEEKRKSSTFLTQVYEELFDYINDLTGVQLIAIPDSTNWEAIVALKATKTGIIKSGTRFGLYDRVNGSGSGLGIVIEKDIILDKEPLLFDIRVSRTDHPYDYSPDVVYGLARSSKEQLEVLPSTTEYFLVAVKDRDVVSLISSTSFEELRNKALDMMTKVIIERGSEDMQTEWSDVVELVNLFGKLETHYTDIRNDFGITQYDTTPFTTWFDGSQPVEIYITEKKEGHW